MKIKNCVPKERYMTFEEEAIYSISENNSYNQAYRMECKNWLKEEGFIKIINSKAYPMIGSFTPDPERDPTLDEEKAYLIKRLFELCGIKCHDDSVIRLGSNKICGENCTFTGRFIREQLEGKEVIK